MSFARIISEIKAQFRELYRRNLLVVGLPEVGSYFDDLPCFRSARSRYCVAEYRDELYELFYYIHRRGYPYVNISCRHVQIFRYMTNVLSPYLRTARRSIFQLHGHELREMARVVLMQSCHVTTYYPNIVFGALVVYVKGGFGERHELPVNTRYLYNLTLLHRLLGSDEFCLNGDMEETDEPSGIEETEYDMDETDDEE